MKKNAKTFKEAARLCTQFHRSEESPLSAKNSTSRESSTEVSCKNCTHYNPSKVCSLNLYEEIVENHHL